MSAEVRPHTFDGIQEFDNRLPNWWLWTFYGACIFSVFYWIHYHTIGTGDLPEEAFRAEQRALTLQMEKELAENPITNERLQQLAEDPSYVAEGRALFVQNCALCHRENGAAGKDDNGVYGAGGNLTDDHWIYGAEPTDIYTTLMKGRTADPEIGSLGGMPAWDALGQGNVLRLTTYVMSIKNTDVPGGKPPEPYATKRQ